MDSTTEEQALRVSENTASLTYSDHLHNFRVFAVIIWLFSSLALGLTDY